MPGFKDILGQQHIKQEFGRALREGKVSHAYILAGEALTGKKFIAGILAQALLCEHPVMTEDGTEPCGDCPSCKKVISYSHPDLRIIAHEKENNISVSEIKEQLMDDCYLRPYTAGRKIYIVPDAERMNQAAQNKLLKTLEEPPSYVTIILLTTSMEALLTTVRSRCVPYRMQPVEDLVLKNYLTKEAGRSQISAEFAVRFARGSAGRAIMLANDSAFAERARRMVALLTGVDGLDIGKIDREVKELFGNKCEDVQAREEFFHITRCLLRDIMLFRATKDAESLILKDKTEYISSVALHTPYRNICQADKELKEASRHIAANVNALYTIEMFLMQLRQYLSVGS